MIPNQAIPNNFSNNQPQWFLNMIFDYKKGFKIIKFWFLWPRLTHRQTYEISWSGSWCDSYKIFKFWAIFSLVTLVKRILIKKKPCIFSILAAIYLLKVNHRNTRTKVWNMFKVNNKNTRMASFWCLYC